MKLKALLLGSAATIFALSSCGSEASNDGQVDTPVAQDSTTTEEETATFTIDATASEVSWAGKKVFSDEGHNGTIAIQSGNAQVAGGKLVGGEIVIDMTAITVLDIDSANGSGGLVAHLTGTGKEEQANDFFNTNSFPTAKYVITSVTDSSLVGELTIKDVTLPYETPATVSVEGEMVTVNGTLTFDRSKFGVEFGTEAKLGLFSELADDLKGYAIQNDIVIGLKIVAKK